MTKVKLHPASSYTSTTVPPTPADRPRSTSRSRHRNHHHKPSKEDTLLPSVSDSVSETGIEVVDAVALSSDYDNGVKIPEYEAAALNRLPRPAKAITASSTIPRQASPPPAIGSNETRKVQPRHRRDSDHRPVSALSSDTQIYAPLPLESTFPADSSYDADEPAFIPEPNVVRPGSMPESAIEGPAPSQAEQSTTMPMPLTVATKRRSRSTIRASASERRDLEPELDHDTYAADIPPSAGAGYGSSSGSNLDVEVGVGVGVAVGIPSIQPGLLPPGPPPAFAPRRSRSSQKRDSSSKYTPVYRDRKAEWLADPANSVAHYREAFKVGHRQFGGISSVSGGDRGAGGRGGGMVLGGEGDFEVRPMSETDSSFSEGVVSVDTSERSTGDEEDGEARLSTSSVSSGVGYGYPPDIPRYRDEVVSPSAGSGSGGGPSGTGRARRSMDVVMFRPGELRREDSGVGVGVGSGSSAGSGSGSGHSRRQKDKEKEKEQEREGSSKKGGTGTGTGGGAGGLLRRLRRVSLAAVR